MIDLSTLKNRWYPTGIIFKVGFDGNDWSGYLPTHASTIIKPATQRPILYHATLNLIIGLLPNLETLDPTSQRFFFGKYTAGNIFVLKKRLL
jgi:hypothetical protein